MASEVSEFWKRLIQSGIADKQDCRSIAESFRKSKFRTSKQGSDGEGLTGLAAFLLHSNWLTLFQHDALLASPPLEFRVGRFVLRDRTATAPFSRMVPVSFAKEAIEQGIADRPNQGLSNNPITARDFAGVLLRTTKMPEDAGEHWFKSFAGIDDPSLQSYEVDELGDYELVFSPMVEGGLLHHQLQNGQKTPEARVCEVGLAITKALSILHAKGVSHGSVRADRVWVSALSPSEIQLLIEPTEGIFDELESPVLSMAPEMIAQTIDSNPQNRGLTPQADVYALGCLLFRLASGRYPFTGDNDEAIKQKHLSDSPKELRDAVREAEQGDPLMRVLAYAMAKDPSARFQTAEQLGAALDAVAEVVGTTLSTPTLASEALEVEPAELGLVKQAPPETSPIESSLSSDQIKITDQEEDLRAEPEPDESKPDEPKPPLRRKRPRKRKRNHAFFVLAGLTCIVMMQIVYLATTDPPTRIAKRSRRRPPIPVVLPAVTDRSVTDVKPIDRKPPTKQTEPRHDRGFQLVADKRLLYAPPYAASNTPVELDLLPPGPSLLISLDGKIFFDDSSVWRNSVAELLLPEWRAALTNITKRIKVPPEKIARVVMAIYPGKGETLDVAMSVRLQQSANFDRLTKAFKISKARTKEGATIFAGDEVDADAYFFRPSEVESKKVSAFALGSVERISDLASIDGEAIPLPRTMETLWKASDIEADFCLMTRPNFLFADGGGLLREIAPGLIDPLRRYFIPDVSAMLVVLDSQDGRLYGEWRIAAAGSVTEASLSRSMRSAVDQWPQWAESIAARKDHHDSLMTIASRFPAMGEFVADQTRIGVSDATAIANVYLPLRSIPQLTFATLYASGLPEKEAVTAEATVPSLPLDEILGLKMSVSFDAEDMQPAFAVVLDALMERLPAGTSRPTLTIKGGDLQLKGITQNQQIRKFTKTDVAFRDVLTALVVSANPDKSASGPSDVKQVLIWAIKRSKDPKTEASEIVITTRDAAEGVYEIPAEFAP